MPWQVPITVDGLEYPVTFNTENEPTQQDYDEAIQQILQQRQSTFELPTETTATPEKETPGYLSQLGSALGLGYRQMKSGVGATFNALTGDTADVATEMAEMAKLQREQQAAQTPEDIQFMRSLEEAEKGYEEAKGPLETIGALAQYPAAVIAEPGAAFKTAIQSAPNALISGATSLAGYGLGGLLGGAATLETGPGAILGGLAGATAGGALSNTLMEAGPSIFDVLNERTQGAASNMTADEIAAYLQENPDIIDEGLKTGAIRGSVIGAVEALGVKGAGRLLTMPERAAARAVQKELISAGVDVASKEAVDKALLNPTLRAATKAAAETAKNQFSSAGNIARLTGGAAIETGAAGAGELAAQAAAGQDISTKEAFMEMLGDAAISLPISATTKAVEGAKYMLNPALVDDLGKASAEKLALAGDGKSAEEQENFNDTIQEILGPPTEPTIPTLEEAEKAPAPTPISIADSPSPNLLPRATKNVKPKPTRNAGSIWHHFITLKEAWEEQYGDMRKGGRTHNDDGTPYQPTVFDEVMPNILAAKSQMTDDEANERIGDVNEATISTSVRTLLNAGWTWDAENQRWQQPENNPVPNESPIDAIIRLQGKTPKVATSTAPTVAPPPAPKQSAAEKALNLPAGTLAPSATPPSPTMEQAAAPAVEEPTLTPEPELYAPAQVTSEESVYEEPQDRVEGREAKEPSLGDSILRPKEGKVEEEVDLKAGLPRQQPGEAPDIITWLKENHARKPIVFVPKARRRKATAEAEALGILDELPLPVKRRLFSFDYGEGKNVANMDEIAGLAYEANLIPSSDPTVLAQSIIEAFKARKAGTSLIKEGEQQMETAEQRTIEFYKAASDRTAPLTLIPRRDLDIGDVVQVGEDKMRVTYEYDEDGYPTVLILTGPKFGEQRFDPNKPLKAENTSNTSDLKAVNNNTASQDQIDALVNRGFVEIYKGSPVITDIGVEQMPKKPKLTADQRKAQIDAEQAAPAERAAEVEGMPTPVTEPTAAEKPTPAPLREGAGVPGVVQPEPPRGSILEVGEVSTKTKTLSTPQSLAQNKEDAKQQKKDSDENLKALNNLEAGTKTNPVFGTVTREDANEAMRLIEDGKELPNVFFTVVTTREEFLADPRNEQLYPQVWNALKTNKRIEGLFDDATNTPFVFTDGVVVYDLDRKAAKELGISPQVAAVRRVLRHENIHKGMLHLTPSEMVAMRRFLATIFSEEALDNLAKIYTKYANWRSDPRLYFQAIEEIVNQKLDQSTVLPKDGIWGQFFELLTAIWRRITGKRNQPTVKDMKDVMRLVRNGLIRSAKAQADQTRDGGNVMLSIRAYHGTPHKVDKFKLDKIGTGEGAQAYGWGLYFAENRGVGEQYKETLSKWTVPNPETEAGYRALGLLTEQRKYGRVDEEARTKAKASIGVEIRDGVIPNDAQLIAEIKKQIDGATGGGGNLYTVELLPDADEFLDWDKPLSEQPLKFKEAFVKLLNSASWSADARDAASRLQAGEWFSGRSAYQAAQNILGGKKTSEMLASLGVPGIRYLDEGSRNRNQWIVRNPQGGENVFSDEASARAYQKRNPEETLIPPQQTRNYVIFDENLVKILEENGQVLTTPTDQTRDGGNVMLSMAAPEMDAEYLAAVEAGDMEKAQRMVNEGKVEMTRRIFDALNVRPDLTQRATTIHKRLTEQGIIQPDEFENGKGLVYGDGKGVASEFLGADSYEPFPPSDFQPDYVGDRSVGNGSKINKNYETILNTFVLNVVDPQTRDFIVRDIANLLKKGGRAVIVTRGTDVLNSIPIQDFGNMSRLQKSGSGITYQKGFEQRELVEYLQKTLGEDFAVQPLKGGTKEDVRAQFVKKVDKQLPNPLVIEPRVPTINIDSVYLNSLQGDSGNDNLNQLLFDASPDERQAVVDSWIERNPNAAAKIQRMVDEAAKAAGYETGWYHGRKTDWTIYDPSTDQFGGLYITKDYRPAEAYSRGKWEGSPENVPEGANVLSLAAKFGKTLDLGMEMELVRGVPNRQAVELLKTIVKARNNLAKKEGWKTIMGTQAKPIKTAGPEWSQALRRKEIWGAMTQLGIRGERLRPILQSLGYDSMSFWGQDNIMGFTEPYLQAAVFNPTQIKSASPVTFDNAGNVIPPSQRFQPTSPDIRFSLPIVHSSESEASYANGQMAASMVTFTPRQMDVYSALEGAYNMSRKTGRHSVPLSELYQAALEALPDMTQQEFSEAVQTMYQNNSALLNAGESNFSVVNKDGDRVSSVVFLGRGPMASMIPSSEVPEIASKLASDLKSSVTEGEQTPYEGLSFTGVTPKTHARVDYRGVRKSAEDFVNQMIRAQRAKGKSYADALIEVANTITNPSFANEYMADSGTEEKLLATQAIAGPLNSKIYSALLTTKDDVTRIKLNDAYTNVSTYYEGSGTIGGTVMGYRAWESTNGKYGWMLDSWKADALKNAEDAINSQMGGSVSIQIGESLRRSVEGVSDSTANEVEKQAQEDRDAALFREGQEALSGKDKNTFESIKSFLKTKAIINRRKLIRAGNQAMASIVSDEEYNAIMAMSDEEANALEKEIDAKLSAALEKLYSSLSGKEDVKAKVDAAINVATDRANKGEDITFTQVTIEEAMADLFKSGFDTRGEIVDDVGNALLKKAKDEIAKSKGKGKPISHFEELIRMIKKNLLAHMPSPSVDAPKLTLADALRTTFAQRVAEANLHAQAWRDARSKIRKELEDMGIAEEDIEAELNAIIPPTPTLSYAPKAAMRAISMAMEETGITREDLLDPRPSVAKNAFDRLMQHFDSAITSLGDRVQSWSPTGQTGRQLAEQALTDAVAKWRANQQMNFEISKIVAEQADNPVSIEDFAKKLSKFNLTPKQVKKYFDIAARAAVRSVEMRKDQARRIIYTRGDIRPDVLEKEVDGDTVIDAFTDQVSSPTDLKTFVERLDKLGVTFDLAESLFNTAARERRDRQRTRVFDMIEGPRALQKMLDEIRNVRAGLEVPLRSPIPWKELLSKPAKSVAEYRQKVLDAIMANPDLASVDSEVKQRLADMFADVWQQQLDNVVNRIIDNYTQQLDRAKRRHAGDVLNKTRLQVIQHLNLNALSNDAFTRILGEKFGIKMELTEAERENIQRLVDILQDETLPKNKRNQAANDLALALVNDTKVGWSERLSAFWTSSVLAGWNTMIAIGLAFLNGANIIMVNLPMKIMSNLINGDFKGAFYSTFDSLNDIKRYIEAFPEALERSWHYLNTGRVEFLESEASAPDRIFRGWADVLRYRKVAEAMANDPKKVTQWMGKFSVMISRMMTALDGFNTILTKRGKLSMAVRLTAKSPEDHQRILEKASLEHYRQQILASDPYFAQMNSEKRALLNATAEAMMYEAMNKEGAKLENADFFASESAMTMNPTGIGGIVYNKIRSADVEVQEFMRRKLAEQKLKAAVAGPMSLESAKLAGMFVAHFIAYNAINMIGLRFARFASNKFNQGLSFIPFVGILRGWEASNNQLADRKEAFYDMIKRNQMVGMFFVGAGSILLRAIADEPDDEKRGFFINGGLKNVPTDKRRQLQESGKLEYRIGAKIGGKWYIWNYQNSPYSQLFAAVGAMSDIIRFSPDKWKEKSNLDVALSVAASGLSSTLDLPALQGLGTLIGRSVSSSDPTEQFWENIGATTANWVGGFIPKPFMDVDYILDDNRRKYTTIWEKFAGKVPFYRRYVGEDYYNILGDPIKANTLPGSREFLVGKTDPVYQILGALNSRNIWLTPANAEYRMVGKGRNRRRLTQKEADSYSFQTGKGYKEMILRYGPRALQMDPERARAFLQDKADEVRDRALKRVYRR